MRNLKTVWKHIFDIREGEWGATVFMSLYLALVMFAYYVLKPVSNAMFLTELKVDKLPLLNVLIAAAGGTLAYVYSKFAARASLSAAITWTISISIACLLGLWWLIGMRQAWIMYVFNIWVSLFSAIIVSQAWLVAANLFDSRAAKRLYGPIGLGGVVGGSFGGVFTAVTARLIGSRNLLFAAVVLLGLAYVAFRLAVSQKASAVPGKARAGRDRDEFTFREILVSISSSRHLKLIVALFSVSLVVSTLADYQYKSIVTTVYKGNDLAAFFGRMNGIYLPAITVPLQFFLTAALVRRLGLGGTLAIMPTMVSLACGAVILVPVLGAAMALELTESSTRYTVNKTGMELLYLPQPARIRNRVKGFIDVFVDRLSRGFGGVVLMILLALGFRSAREVAVASLAFCAVWLGLCVMAQREYVRTIRDRLARRRLDLDELRMNISDPAVISLFEQTAANGAARPARYALAMLAEAPRYDIKPLLRKLADSPLPEVRAKVFEIAWFVQLRELVNAAGREISQSLGGRNSPALGQAVQYWLTFSDDPATAARDLVDHPNQRVAESAVQFLRLNPAMADAVLTAAWIAFSAQSDQPPSRRLAATAIGIRGAGKEWLPQLLADPDQGVCAAAMHSAAALGDREYLDALVSKLADVHLRGPAIDALVAFGSNIVGTLADLLHDDRTPSAIRRQIPRVLRAIPEQRSLDVLLNALSYADIPLRGAILKALNHLREIAPALDYGRAYVTEYVLAEARYYCELHASLAAINPGAGERTPTGLLARTLEHRATNTMERLFHLLGLRYPQVEIQAAYRSLRGSRAEETVAALDLLESVLEHSLRRVVVPLLESNGSVVETGKQLFRIEVDDPESAMKEMIQQGDGWLAACAMAAAAEQGFRQLRPDIEALAQRATADVAEVARSAAAVLA